MRTLLFLFTLATSAAIAEEFSQPVWGPLEPVEGVRGRFEIEIPPAERIPPRGLPTPFPQIVKATLGGDPIPVEFNEDATEIELLRPEGGVGPLRIDIADDTVQHPDGRIVFSARDAAVDGDTAKLETHPGNHRIGFWSDPADTVRWDYKATRPGMYDVELTYSLAAGGSEVEIDYGGGETRVTLAPTGSWYRYTTVPAGRVYLADDRAASALTVTPVSKAGAAVMNIKAVLLTPAPEGGPITQEGDTVTLLAEEATTHGVKMRYEPQPHKNCLGYWANPADWASWDFTATEAGTYRVFLTQGCGKGHGGSVAKVLLDKSEIEFTVADTGGFQNWLRRDLGTVEIAAAGPARLEVRPVSKAGVAVMDIQKIELVRER